VDIGADKLWKIDAPARLHTGLYADYGKSDADYKTPGAEAELTSTYGGVYATYIYNSGLYIDAVLKAATINNKLTAPHGATNIKAETDSLNLGASLELGYRSELENGWYIEPQLQLAYLHIFAKNYTATGGTITLPIAAADMDTLQLRALHTIGKTIRLAHGGHLQPYIKFGGAVLSSTGGEIRTAHQRLRPNTDGARAEAGAGLLWQPSASHQLHLDYEAAYAEKYNKPWGLTAAYRWQF
jgi:outer membrane autotransporter protein